MAKDKLRVCSILMVLLLFAFSTYVVVYRDRGNKVLVQSLIGVWSGPERISQDCTRRLNLAVPAVNKELRKSMKTAQPEKHSTDTPPNAAETQSCQPKMRKIDCSSFVNTTLPCNDMISIPEYNYHHQFDCIDQIAKQIQATSRKRVPRLFHTVWLYGGRPENAMELHVYIGLTSILHFFRPDAIFFWNNGTWPTGPWWQELLTQINQPQNSENMYIEPSYRDRNGRTIPSRKVRVFQTKFYSIVRNSPTEIYGNAIKKPHHASDIIRLEALMQFGGLYADTDAIALRPLDELLDFTVTLGSEKKGTLGNSIIFAEPHAPFLYLWHHSYITFNSREWAEHSTEGSQRIAADCVTLIHVEKTSLMQPSDLEVLFLRDLQLDRNFMLHLYWNWCLALVAKNCLHPRDPSDLLNWHCTVGRILRNLYFGTCENHCF